ncbi:MAG TPA: hypothetical protein DHN33_03955 [Eubacteriaceae bacterium]|nr:hypothetical protein [Eubacteriaceae bacterium]
MDIVQIVKKELEEIIKKKTPSHAYLFVGSKGTNKRANALRIAKGMLCEKGGDDPHCSCSSCKRVEESNHPDFREIGKDGQSIKIDDIRFFQRDIAKKPYEGDYKIYLIYNGQTMKAPAQNALLKMLEEPLNNRIIILLSTSKESLLPTILSRCQVFYFTPLKYDAFYEEMQRQFGYGDERIRSLFQMTQGRLGEAMHYIEHPEEWTFYEEIKKDLDRVLEGDKNRIFTLGRQLRENKVDEREVTDFLLMYFRDLMMDALEGKQEKKKDLTIEKINDIIEGIFAWQGTININVNKQLQLENLLLKI